MYVRVDKPLGQVAEMSKPFDYDAFASLVSNLCLFFDFCLKVKVGFEIRFVEPSTNDNGK